jgi:hypothetical protein
MRTPMRLNGSLSVAGKAKPSALSMIIIRQFAKSIHVEKKLHIPDNIFFIN